MKIVKAKSVANVDDARLLDSLEQLHEIAHTPAGIRAFSDSKRTLCDRGVRIAHICAELVRRDVAWPPCRFCRPAVAGLPRSLHG